MSEPRNFSELAIWKTGFDTGIESVAEFVEMARYEEQERIIKLLEEIECGDWVEIRLDALIALIKGEK